jgi:hypothetical protein
MLLLGVTLLLGTAVSKERSTTLSWNYRVVKRTYKRPIGPVEEVYQVHEAYYLGDNKPFITVDSVAAQGDTVEELRGDLERMLKALDKPVLDHGTREEL